jgi:hypothetical protein
MWREEDRLWRSPLIGFGHQDLVNMVGYFDSDRLFPLFGERGLSDDPRGGSLAGCRSALGDLAPALSESNLIRFSIKVI